MARNFGPRAKKRWAGMGTAITQSVSADVTGIVAGFVEDVDPTTVLRIIGEYTIGPGGVNVVNDQCVWILGIGVFSKDAVTVGGTVMPDPEDEAGFPWLFWAQHIMVMQVAQQDSQGDPLMALRRSYDIRSMRKIGSREVLAQVFQFRDISGAPTYDLSWGVNRVLLAVS